MPADTSRHAVWLTACIAALIVACWAPDVVTSATAFFTSPDSDPAQHLIGARYFFADLWRWPLLSLPELGTPQGSNLTMTDSIPLAAILTKLLKPLLGVWPDYFGPWLLLCFTLQAAGFAAIARALDIRERWVIIAVGLLGLASPMLLFRTAHIALCSQFLLLFPLAAYWRYSRHAAVPLPFLTMAAWLAAGLLIHPYLAAMQLAIGLAIVLAGLWQGRLLTRHALAALAGWLGVLLLIGWICGNAGVALPWGSYGVAPLNLAAPWYPQLSGLFAPDRMIDPTGYHYDAYNYWGAGFLFAAVAGAIIAVRLLSARHVGRIPSSPESAATLDSSAAPPPLTTPANASAMLRHAPLALVLWLLTIYAVGYDVYWIDVPVAGIRAADVMASFNRADGITSIIALLRAHAGGLILLGFAYLLPIFAFITLAIGQRRWASLRFIGMLLAGAGLLLALAPERSLRTVSNFAASGRFFWVVGYALVPAAIALCYRHLSRRGFALLLIGVIALQFADMRPLFDIQRGRFAQANPRIAELAALQPQFAAATRVDIQPRFGCVKNHYTELRTGAWPQLSSTYMALHWLAAQRTLPTNSVYQARADDRAGCDALYGRGLPPPAADALTIYVDVPGYLPLQKPTDNRFRCQPLPFGQACAAIARPAYAH